MSYAVLQDAIDLYGVEYVNASVDRDDDGSPDTDSLETALDQASSFIDSFLAGKYDVPLATVPTTIVSAAVDIAIYRCSSHPGAGLTDEKRRRYEDAEKWLTNIAKGIVVLPVDEDAVTSPSASESEITLADTDRLFTRSTQRGLR